MSGSARIDDLERKYGENPGRYFVPLANEYRKAGQLERAVEVCREQLSAQPDHLSGHVVLGKALFALGDRQAATLAFESALRVDPENLDALHQLALLARDDGHGPTALDFARRALAVDPLDPELLAIASDLSAPPEEDVAPPSFDPRQMFEDYSTPPRAVPEGQNPLARPRAVDELLRPAFSAEAERAEAAPDKEAPEKVAAGGEVASGEDGASEASPPSEVTPGEDAEDEAGSQSDVAVGSASAPSDATEMVDPWGGTPPGELPDSAVDMISSWPAESAGPEHAKQVTGDQPSEAAEAEPAAEQEPLERPVSAAVERAGRLTPSEEWPDLDWPVEPQEPKQLADVRQPSPPDAPPTVVDDEPAPTDPPLARLPEEAEVEAAARVTFVTETMAELLLKQGRRSEAARVYRELLMQNPGDPRIQARLDAIFAAPHETASGDVRPKPAPIPTPQPQPVAPSPAMGLVKDAIAAAEAFGIAEEVPGPPASPPMRELLTRILAYTPPVGGEPVTSAFLTESRESAPERSLPGGLVEAVESAELAARQLADAGAALGDPGVAATLERAAASQAEPIAEVLARPTPSASDAVDGFGAGVSRQAPSFSFDQFFRDVMPDDEKGSADEAATQAGELSRAAEIDDTDDFRAWLDGLRKS